MKQVLGVEMELHFQKFLRLDLLHRIGKYHPDKSYVLVESFRNVIKLHFTLSSVVWGLMLSFESDLDHNRGHLVANSKNRCS